MPSNTSTDTHTQGTLRILWSFKQPLRILNFYGLSFACFFLRFSSAFLKPHSTSSEAGNMKKSQWVKGCGKKGVSRGGFSFAEFSGLQSQHLFHPLGRNYVAWDVSPPPFIFRPFLVFPHFSHFSAEPLYCPDFVPFICGLGIVCFMLTIRFSLHLLDKQVASRRSYFKNRISWPLVK